jgi:hypothetical protein
MWLIILLSTRSTTRFVSDVDSTSSSGEHLHDATSENTILVEEPEKFDAIETAIGDKYDRLCH